MYSMCSAMVLRSTGAAVLERVVSGLAVCLSFRQSVSFSPFSLLVSAHVLVSAGSAARPGLYGRLG